MFVPNESKNRKKHGYLKRTGKELKTTRFTLMGFLFIFPDSMNGKGKSHYNYVIKNAWLYGLKYNLFRTTFVLFFI